MFGIIDRQEIIIGINGMHCEMCSARMQKAFLDAKGVLKAEVSLSDKCADIVYDAGKISAKDLKNIVTETGYEPV